MGFMSQSMAKLRIANCFMPQVVIKQSGSQTVLVADHLVISKLVPPFVKKIKYVGPRVESGTIIFIVLAVLLPFLVT